MICAVLASAALATAAPDLDAPELPLSPRWRTQASALGGMDRWTGGGGQAAQLGLRGWGQRSLGGWDLAGGYAGVAEVLSGQEIVWIDHHRAVVELRRRRPWHPGLAGGVSSGLLTDPSWYEGAGALTLGGPAGPHAWIYTRVGAFGRTDRWLAGQGLSASAQWLRQGPRGGRASVRARLRATQGDLPPFIADGDLWLGTSRDTGLDLDVGLGARWAAPGRGIDDSVVGLPSPGTLTTRSTAIATFSLHEHLGFQVELGGELGWGARPYVRGSAMAGLVARLGSRPPIPEWAHSERSGVSLSLDPGPWVATVSVVGTFSDWEPIPMHLEDDGWRVVLELEPGEYEYVYLVDGEPLAPPEAHLTRSDGFGGENGILVVLPK